MAMASELGLSKCKGLARFKEAARIVRIFVSVCNRLIQIAADHGKYTIIKSDAKIKLHSAVEWTDDKNLLFDPGMYKSKLDKPVPEWLIAICSKLPAVRTDADIRRLCCLMKQIKAFHKFTKEMLNLLAKAALFQRFEKGRVIVRKGHSGRTLYVILKGSVALLNDENEEAVLNEKYEKENENRGENGKIAKNDTILRKGDCFGKKALFKCIERQSTAVCLSATSFLVVNLEKVCGIDLEEFLNKEVSKMFMFLNSLPAFEKFSEKGIQSVAERSHVCEYLAEKVIVKDSRFSDFIYVCCKGRCVVLRKIKNAVTKASFHKQRKISMASESISSFLPWTISRSRSGQSSSLSTGSKFSSKSLRRSQLSRLSTCSSKCSSANSVFPTIQSGLMRTNVISSCPAFSNFNCTQNETRSEGNKRNAPKKYEDLTSSSTTVQRSSYYSYDLTNRDISVGSGDGVLVKVAQLSRGDCFGMDFSNDDEIFKRKKRSFMLVSSGCEVIAIKRSTLLQILNREGSGKLEAIELTYPKDEELYRAFQEEEKWKSYRQQVVGCFLERKNLKQGTVDRS